MKISTSAVCNVILLRMWLICNAIECACVATVLHVWVWCVCVCVEGIQQLDLAVTGDLYGVDQDRQE